MLTDVKMWGGKKTTFAVKCTLDSGGKCCGGQEVCLQVHVVRIPKNKKK